MAHVSPISQASETSRSVPASARPWLGLALLALPTMLLGIDLTILHLALPALAEDLRPTSSQALWILDAYGFMIAGFLVTMGTLGDRIGRRRLLMIGAVAFGAASLFAAFSTSPAMLIIARAALGVAGATLMPSTLALISNMFRDPRQRGLAIGIWATTFALGMAIGPVVGGLLLQSFWWGSVFLLALPIVVLLLVLGPLLLPEYRAPGRGRIDLVSVAFFLLGLLPIIYAMKEMAKLGPSLLLLSVLVAGVAMMVLFVRRQKRLDDPLLDLALFRNGPFTAALLVMLFGLVAVAGTMLLVSQYLQLVAGYSPLVAGLWLGLPALAMVIAGVTAPLLARRFRPGLIVAAALAISVPGYALLTVLEPTPSGVTLAVAAFSLAYLGLGTTAALGTDLVVGAAPKEKAGSASALSETVQDLGASLGIALLGSFAAASYRFTIAEHVPDGLDATAAAALTDSLWTALAFEHLLPAGLLDTARAAFTSGINSAAILSTITVAILAIVAATTLRSVPPFDAEGPAAHH